MSQLSVTTKQSNEVWSKGDRTIWDVVLDYNGKLVKAKTFSQTISRVGWQGLVITDERPGRDGEPQTFVKQPPKDDGFKAQPKDEKAISAMWSIGQAIAFHSDNASLNTIEETAKELFLMVDRVKATQVTDKVEVADRLYDADGPVDFSKLTEVFDEED